MSCIRLSLSTASIAAQSHQLSGRADAVRAALTALNTVLSWCSTKPFWGDECRVVRVRSVPPSVSGRIREGVIAQAHCRHEDGTMAPMNPDARSTTRCRYLFPLPEAVSGPVVSWLTTSSGRPNRFGGIGAMISVVEAPGIKGHAPGVSVEDGGGAAYD
eukprot:IDg15419t1